MISAQIENKMKRPIGEIIDLKKLAWGLFQHVDHKVPTKIGRLRASAELIAGTVTLIRGNDLKHHSTLLTRNVVSLTYSTPKSVTEQANVFYLYGTGQWFDYAHKQEEEKAYVESTVAANIGQIVDEAIVQR